MIQIIRPSESVHLTTRNIYGNNEFKYYKGVIMIMKKILSTIVISLIICLFPLLVNAEEAGDNVKQEIDNCDQQITDIIERTEDLKSSLDTQFPISDDEQNIDVQLSGYDEEQYIKIQDIDEESNGSNVEATNKSNNAPSESGTSTNTRMIGDIDGDNAITSADALVLLRCSVGLGSDYGVGTTENVTVTSDEKSEPTNLSLNKTSVSLTVGETATLTATVSPSNAANQSVTWSSSNNSVATVSNGKVTAKSAGTATITAKTHNGITATCNVTVTQKEVNPTSISINETSVSLNVGETTTLTATVSPSNASNKTVTWSSSNDSVATVSNGKVTARSAGSATITAKTANGITTTCSVTVKTPVSSTEANCEKLKNYILSNYDYINKNGDKGLKIINSEYNTTSVVVYDSTNDSFDFITIMEKSGSKTYSTLEYNYKTGYVNDTELYIYSVVGFQLTASYNASSVYRKQNISYNEVNNTAGSSSSAQEIANGMRETNLLGATLLIYEGTGLQLSDIGFTSYNYK